MMIEPILLLAFAPVALALKLTPGADRMFCLAQGMRGGACPAIAASAGIYLGGIVHVVLAGRAFGGLLINGLAGIFASGRSKRLLHTPRAESALRYISATVFGGLAVRIGWEAAHS